MTSDGPPPRMGCLRTVLALALAVPTYSVAVPLLLILRGVLFLALDAPCLLLAKLRHKSGHKRTLMRPEDSFMMMETSKNRCNIVTVVELNSPDLELSQLVSLLDRTLISLPASAGPEANQTSSSLTELKWPRFRQRPVNICSCWFWEDLGKDFTLASHFRELADIVDEAALTEFLARCQSEQMDADKPLWDVAFVRPGVLAGGATVVIRLHHCMGDGVQLMRVLLDSLALEGGGNGAKAAAPPLVGHRGAPLWSVLLQAPLLAVEQLITSRDRTRLKPSSLSGTKVAAFVPTIELQRVKAVARAHRTTVSAVVVACLGQALASLPRSNGNDSSSASATTSAASSDRASSAESLKFWVPVSLAREGKAEMKNELIFMMMPIPLEATSPAAALQAADVQLRDMKASDAGPAFALIIKAAMFLMPFAIAHPFLNFIGNKATGVFSSVPGPSEELSWGGMKVSGMRFLVPHRGGIAIGFSALSYAGQLRVTVNCDAAVLSDPGMLAAGWLAALRELEGAEAAQ